MSFRDTNKANLKNLIEVMNEDNQRPNESRSIQFQQANQLVLLGGGHAQNWVGQLTERFDNEKENYKAGFTVSTGVCQGMMKLFVTRGNQNQITQFTVQIRFDNQIFGPRPSIKDEFKEEVSLALRGNAQQFGFDRNIALQGNIGWTIGNPL